MKKNKYNDADFTSETTFLQSDDDNCYEVVLKGEYKPEHPNYEPSGFIVIRIINNKPISIFSPHEISDGIPLDEMKLIMQFMQKLEKAYGKYKKTFSNHLSSELGF